MGKRIRTFEVVSRMRFAISEDTDSGSIKEAIEEGELEMIEHQLEVTDADGIKYHYETDKMAIKHAIEKGLRERV